MIPILITLLTALPGQDEILKKSLYFDNDKFLVTQNHINELTLFFDSLEHENIASILIEGHTDSNADSIYNIALSDRRVLSIDSLIRQIVGEGLPIFTNYFGENRPLLSNETEGGRQENRRVDVFVHLNISELEIYPNLLPKDTCIPGDTTIIMEGGTELVFDRCEYREKKDCLKITEVVTVSEMETNGLTTQTTSGDPLITFGMIGIEASPECDSCFQNPVTVRFLLDPVPDKCLRCATPATIWSMDTSSRWFTDSRGEPDIKVVEIGGLKYAEFKLYCPGWKNYDCIPSGKPKKVKFKARGGLKINSISLIYDCPTSRIVLDSNFRKTKKLPCWPDPNIGSLTVTDKSGDTLTINSEPLNDFANLRAFPRCKKRKVVRRVIGIPIRERVLFRKYVFRKKDFSVARKEP